MTDIPSGYTPGPWEIEPRSKTYVSISAPKHLLLARVVWCLNGEEATPSCEANARLIALAPEMADEIVRLRADLAQVREELNLNRLGLSLTRDQRDDLRALNAELLEGLNTIAAWHDGPKVSGHFDEPAAASVARALIAKAEGRT